MHFPLLAGREAQLKSADTCRGLGASSRLPPASLHQGRVRRGGRLAAGAGSSLASVSPWPTQCRGPGQHLPTVKSEHHTGQQRLTRLPSRQGGFQTRTPTPQAGAPL